MKRREFLVSRSPVRWARAWRGWALPACPMTPPRPQATPARARSSSPAADSARRSSATWPQLTGKPRPKLCYLPTASADSPTGIISWFRNCAPLNVEPSVQESFIASTRQTRSWEEVFLSMDGIVVSGGNTLNQQAIWKAQGIDVVLRQAWDRGIVLGGASAGSLCWFEEGTTDSRPKELTTVQCLGFLKGSHSPHYDREAGPPAALPEADRLGPDEARLRLRQRRRHLLRGQRRQARRRRRARTRRSTTSASSTARSSSA